MLPSELHLQFAINVETRSDDKVEEDVRSGPRRELLRESGPGGAGYVCSLDRIRADQDVTYKHQISPYEKENSLCRPRVTD